MSAFFTALATKIAEEIGDRLASELIEILRKRARVYELDQQASSIKEELKHAQSDAEREAVLDKIHSLINGFKRV